MSEADTTSSEKSLFLTYLDEEKSVVKAAKRTTKARSTFYLWREKDEAFAKAWDEITAGWVDELEGSALKRCIDGILKPVWQSGRLMGHVREYAEAGLVVFLLKKMRPEKYDDKAPGDGATPQEFAKSVIETIAMMRASVPPP